MAARAWAQAGIDALERVEAISPNVAARLVDALHDPAGADLLAEARELGLHLEVCPTSNVHTGAAASIATHPITALWQAGLSLSYHTDNRLMSCITHNQEAAELLRHTPLTAGDLLAMARHAAGHSFLPPAARAAALDAIDAVRSDFV